MTDKTEVEKKNEGDWGDISENEEEETKKVEVKQKSEKPVEMRKELVIPGKEEKKTYLKNQYGDIVINKLDTYIEPTKQIKEARGDTSIFFVK